MRNDVERKETGIDETRRDETGKECHINFDSLTYYPLIVIF